MKKVLYLLTVGMILTPTAFAQLCPGGGLTFATAAAFNQGWLTNCPGSGTTHNNQVACEPTTAMDACAPAPACISGTAGSDLWYYFYAGATSVSIIINPSASFDAALQAFSGSACPGLTDIGCVDVGGNNEQETLNLTGLTLGVRYYFRVFGATASAPNRAGTFTFCGTSSTLRQFGLPVTLTSFSAQVEKGNVDLKWITSAEIDHDRFEVERSTNNSAFATIGSVDGRGTMQTSAVYNLRDVSPQPGMNYYHLKIVDLNGQFTYSSIISVKVNYVKTVTILENQVSDEVVILARKTTVVNICNSAGQLLRQAQLKQGRNSISIGMWPNGIYFVRQEGLAEAEKFVIGR